MKTVEVVQKAPGRTVESEILLCLILLFYRGLLIWALPRCTSMHCHTHVCAPWQGPNSIPYPEELLASSYCNAFYRQRVWVCEASNKTLQVKTKYYQIADNSTKTNAVSGVCSPASPLVSQKNALFHVHVLTNKLKVTEMPKQIWIPTTSNIG